MDPSTERPTGQPPAPASRGTIASLVAAIPPAPLGFPLVAWIGGVIYLGIFVLIFGSYVF